MFRNETIFLFTHIIYKVFPGIYIKVLKAQVTPRDRGGGGGGRQRLIEEDDVKVTFPDKQTDTTRATCASGRFALNFYLFLWSKC